MGETFKPTDAAQVAEAVSWALGAEKTLEIRGGGSKRGLGRPVKADHVLDLGGLSGITLYEPEELVMTAHAGTPLADIEAVLKQHGQQLAFEPGHWQPLTGGGEGTGDTIGGTFACNISGPRRFKAGAARDHLLGLKGVSGRGEDFKTGGRVVKNVTGYDLCKLMTGSFGTLAALTEVTFKVLPAPEKVRTVLVYGLDDEAAVSLMAEAACSPHEVSGLAHLPAAVAARSAVDYVAGQRQAVTALRVEGPGPSVEYRCQALRRMAEGRATVEELHSHNSGLLWAELRDVAALAGDSGRCLWRLSAPPMAGAKLAAAIARQTPREAWYDWAGGLLWLAVEAVDGGVDMVRDALDGLGEGGHATLVRAPDGLREQVPVLQPQADSLAALSARVKIAFDPRGVLNPGRMYSGI